MYAREAHLEDPNFSPCSRGHDEVWAQATCDTFVIDVLLITTSVFALRRDLVLLLGGHTVSPLVQEGER
jgi:hypothetical protein